MPATYVIGDIHGAFEALKQLVKRLSPREEDTLLMKEAGIADPGL